MCNKDIMTMQLMQSRTIQQWMIEDKTLNPNIQSQNTERNLNVKQRNIMVTTLQHDMSGWCKNLTDSHIKAVNYFAFGNEERVKLTVHMKKSNPRQSHTHAIIYHHLQNKNRKYNTEYYFVVKRRTMLHVGLLCCRSICMNIHHSEHM